VKAMPAISRESFAQDLMREVKENYPDSYNSIANAEKVFLEIAKLGAQTVPPSSQQIDIPQFLTQLQGTSLVMPIQENLTPQMPSISESQDHSLATSSFMEVLALKKKVRSIPQSADIQLSNFPAYKENPVSIIRFGTKATIMASKE